MKSFYNRITSQATKLATTYHWWVAGALIALMGVLGAGSMLGNSAIMDEVAHISAGYSYLHYQDYRLNPEHPPLIKDLAALPLQFMQLKFPDNRAPWTSDVNGQWETGWYFLYHLGNDADKILFWSRLPILLLALGFGVGFYILVRRRWGTGVGLLALFFYCLSPNIIAHSTVVTTDVGASIFMFLGIISFANFVRKPSLNTWVWLSLGLAAAQLAKFSSVLLYPYLAVWAVGLGFVVRGRPRYQQIKVYLGGFIGASVLSLIWIWMYYATQVARMPIATQDALIRGALKADRVRYLADILLSFNHLPLMKPLAQYLLGICMVDQRLAGGNVTYFNGQVTALSFPGYFPELFLLKTQLSLLILGVILIAFAGWRLRGSRFRALAKLLGESIREHTTEWLLGGFAVFFLLVAVSKNLNIGVRHILPIYLPLFVLVSTGCVGLLRRLKKQHVKPAMGVLVVLLGWYGASTVLSYPNYMSYFNEAILGQGNSGEYFSDSSVDWGQDLKRLRSYVHDQGITQIAVDYFGGGVPAYYFCHRKYDAAGALVETADGYDCTGSPYHEWHAQNGIYTGQYIAVSETFLENDRYYAAYYHRAGYSYLRQREPVAKIGNSIYVYKLY